MEICFGSAGHETALLFGDSYAHVHRAPTGPLLGLRPGPPSPFPQMSLNVRRDNLLAFVTHGSADARPAGQVVLFGSSGVVQAVASAKVQRLDPAREVYCAAESRAQGNIADYTSVVVLHLSRQEVVGSLW